MLTRTKNDPLASLRKLVERHSFLWIIDEDSPPDATGLGVHDRRGGRNLGTWIDSEDSLAYLVRHGAEAWLLSSYNGGSGK